MFRKTKIVCTLGPSTDKEGVLKRLIEEGMNVARFNFSHGDHEEQLGRLQMLQKLRKELKRPVAALLDTKGPEIRLRDFTDGKVELKDGQTFTLTTDEIMGDAKRVSITYKNLPEDVKPGDRILIDDGLIGMEVKEIKVTSGAKADKDGNKPKDIICQVLNGGVISNRKGVNVPNVELSMPYISEKDYGDIVFAVEHDYDLLLHLLSVPQMMCLQSARSLQKKAARISISLQKLKICRVYRILTILSVFPMESW